MTIWQYLNRLKSTKLNAVYYLGERLALQHQTLRNPSQQGSSIALDLTDLDKAERKLVYYLRQQTLDYAKTRSLYWSNHMAIAPPTIKVRRYKRRVGCCHPHQNTLTFHERLIQAPPVIIDYVIVHELCHLEYPHHQRSFWQKVARFDPNYTTHHQWLKDNGRCLYQPLQTPSVMPYPSTIQSEVCYAQ